MCFSVLKENPPHFGPKVDMGFKTDTPTQQNLVSNEHPLLVYVWILNKFPSLWDSQKVLYTHKVWGIVCDKIEG